MYIFNAKYERKNKRAIIKEHAISECETLEMAWHNAVNHFINHTNHDEILVDIKWNRVVIK